MAAAGRVPDPPRHLDGETAVADALDDLTRVCRHEGQRGRPIVLPALHLEPGVDGEADDVGLPLPAVGDDHPTALGALGEGGDGRLSPEPSLHHDEHGLAVVKQGADDPERHLAGPAGETTEARRGRTQVVRIDDGPGRGELI
jgi:hypothetical protein